MNIETKNCAAFDCSTASKDSPVWTKCVFRDAPPEGYSSWREWVKKSTETGLFTGVEIKAVRRGLEES